MITVKQLGDKHACWAVDYYRKPSGRPTREADNLATAFAAAVDLAASSAVAEIDVAWLGQVQEQLIAQGLARTTINARVRRIRRVFKWGVRQGLVPAEVLVRLQSIEPLKRGRTRAKEARPIEPVDERLVMRTAAGSAEPMRSMILLMWWTGMRIGELCIMRPADLDQAEAGWTYRPREHKTEHHGQDRIIAIGPRARAELEPWLSWKGNPFLFPSVAAERFVFQTRRGTPWTPDSLRQAVRRSTDRLSLEPWTPLQLRHAAATRLRKLIGVEAARTVLGHSRLQTTEIYAERDLESARDAMQLLG
ncbi:MAG: site-specific integrase [Planctomycetota bacterium]